jgi:hypothetical protein
MKINDSATPVIRFSALPDYPKKGFDLHSIFVHLATYLINSLPFPLYRICPELRESQLLYMLLIERPVVVWELSLASFFC